MRFLKPTVILLLSVICFGCGYRTAPEPYLTVSKDLPKIKNARLNFRGRSLLFRWNLPEKKSQKDDKQSTKIDTDLSISIKKIDYFRINIFKKQTQCYSCKAERYGRIRLYPGDKKIANEEIPWRINLNTLVWNQNGKHFELEVPILFFPEYIFIDHTFFTIDFVQPDGTLSVASGRLTPIKPLKIPLPVVQMKKKGPFVFLSWQPQYEVVRHVFEEGGKLLKEDRFYGLNLYLIRQKGLLRTEQQLNAEPLQEGTYSLSDFHGPNLYGRHVDRYGNESEKVLILEEDTNLKEEKTR